MLGKSTEAFAEEAEQPAVVGEVVAEVDLLAVDELADHDNIINTAVH